ncbi:hypothetical protein CF326_g8701 [Tilletia indica]|nr:hypothetical protein CF326_g8701 [Tilletia indica]
MSTYVALLIKTSHRRSVAAIGGMAAQIPIKDDLKANDAAIEKICNKNMLGPCPDHISREEVHVSGPAQLWSLASGGKIIEERLRFDVAALRRILDDTLQQL